MVWEVIEKSCDKKPFIFNFLRMHDTFSTIKDDDARSWIIDAGLLKMKCLLFTSFFRIIMVFCIVSCIGLLGSTRIQNTSRALFCKIVDIGGCYVTYNMWHIVTLDELTQNWVSRALSRWNTNHFRPRIKPLLDTPNSLP